MCGEEAGRAEALANLIYDTLREMRGYGMVDGDPRTDEDIDRWPL